MHLSSIPLVAILLVLAGPTQAQIYRCGNEYTNTDHRLPEGPVQAGRGGNVTVVQGFKPPAAAASAPAPPVANGPAGLRLPPPAGSRVDNAEQKARDSDAKLILESELKKAEARQAELLRIQQWRA
jgi:hypothetical protein